MSIYNHSRDPEAEQPDQIDRYGRAGYRSGWIWIPVAVFGLLVVLLIGVGFIYGGYSDPTRAYDDGTRLEQTGGDTTMPSLPTPFPNANPPEEGLVGDPGRSPVFPEDAPAIWGNGY